MPSAIGAATAALVQQAHAVCGSNGCVQVHVAGPKNGLIPDPWGRCRMRNGPTQPLRPNLSRMLRRALRAHEQGEFDKAERLYTAVLQVMPTISMRCTV